MCLTREEIAAPVAGVVLAAGSGSRMGRIKQLLPFRGAPLLAHVVASARGAGLQPVVPPSSGALKPCRRPARRPFSCWVISP